MNSGMKDVTWKEIVIRAQIKMVGEVDALKANIEVSEEETLGMKEEVELGMLTHPFFILQQARPTQTTCGIEMNDSEVQSLRETPA